jgi:protein TonB
MIGRRALPIVVALAAGAGAALADPGAQPHDACAVTGEPAPEFRERDPQPVVRVPPKFPVRAIDENVTGVVEISLTIATDGTPKDIRVVSSTPPGYFEEAALIAVRQWTYLPAQRCSGEIVERDGVRVVMRFML